MSRRRTNRALWILCVTATLAGATQAASLHVDQAHPQASDENPGTAERPLATVGRAAAVAEAGDTVLVHAGVYRETVALERSGQRERPIRLAARPGDLVVLSGTEPVQGEWSLHEGSIYKTTVDGPVRQLFVDGKMMVEARWPNMRFPDQLWDRSCWASAGKGSRYGKMVDPRLAESGVDWTGAVAVLNVAHQFYSWTRSVGRHAKGSDTFQYAKDLSGITHFADKTRPWEDDRYYLFGKLEALDAAGEWYHDAETKTLYVWTPDGDDPAAHAVEVKSRDYGLKGEGLRHVEVSGFHFFGCTFSFTGAGHVAVKSCHLLYPSFARRLQEKGSREDSVASEITGSQNAVRHCSFAYGATTGLRVQGAGNVVENNLLHDFCFSGSLRFVGLSLGGTPAEDKSVRNVARYNTLFNLGNAVINYRGPGHVVEYNHVYNGGLACKDVALVYTGQPSTAGNVVRYNWVHGCYTEGLHPGGLRGGLGIRGDDQTRSLTVHHNVVWDCGRDGIIVKGDHNRVVNNTVFDIGTEERRGNYVNLHTGKEPEKWWRKQFPLLPVQNANSLIANNAALTITGHNRGTPYPFAENLVNNFQGEDLKLVDPDHYDFRPREDSPLVDAGKLVEGFNEGYRGAAPDVGAYERGGERWAPGYRNALWLMFEESQDNDVTRLAVRLAMPPLEPVRIEFGAHAAAGTVRPARLTFTPENWFNPQTLAFPKANRLVRCRIEQYDFEESVKLEAVDQERGVKRWFRTVP